MIFTDFR